MKAEKIVKEQARGKARARAPRRKRFGLFQFDFSSVAVALTTIRRRGTVLCPLFLSSLSLSFCHPHSFPLTYPSLSLSLSFSLSRLPVLPSLLLYFAFSSLLPLLRSL